MALLFNVLDDEERLFTVKLTGGGKEKMSLPQILSELSSLSSKDSIEDFPYLRPYQYHSFYSFLVQLSAMALAQMHYEDAIPKKIRTDDWRQMLLRLSDDDDLPWHLLVDDVEQPAFFQPPFLKEDSKNRFNRFKGFKQVSTPDELDIIVNAKNHDVKRHLYACADPEHWIYALISMQTMSGYSGARNYGIARMNSGYGNRPCVCRIPGFDYGERFRRDVRVLLTYRQKIIKSYNYKKNGGHRLLWLLPWGGNKSEVLDLQQLDPYFIEICRRVRLIQNYEASQNYGNLIAMRIGTTARRINADIYKGNIGDPWTPLRVVEDKSDKPKKKKPEVKGITVSYPGFDYRMIHSLIFEQGYRGSLLQRPHILDGPTPIYYFSTLVRGQGETDGFYERYLPVPVYGEKEWASIGKISAERLEETVVVKKEILRYSLLIFYQNLSRKPRPDYDDERVIKVLEEYDRRIDSIFFMNLWADAGIDEGDAYDRWIKELYNIAKSILVHAFEAAAISSARKFRCRWKSISYFQFKFGELYPEIFDEESKKGIDKTFYSVDREKYSILQKKVQQISMSFHSGITSAEIAALKRITLTGHAKSTVFARIEKIYLQDDGLKNGITEEERRKRWACVLSGMANIGDYNTGRSNLGYALGDAGLYEHRFVQFLEAKGDDLLQISRIISQYLAKKGRYVSWADIAYMIFNEDDDEFRMALADKYFYMYNKVHKKKSKQSAE